MSLADPTGAINMHAFLRISIVALLFVLFAGFSSAAVIYDNGTPDKITGVPSDFAWPNHMADDFVLSATVGTTITDAHWWGVYNPNDSPTTDDFTLRIYADQGGSPHTSPLHDIHVGSAVTRTDTGDDFVTTVTLDIYEYAAIVPPISLSAGTTYWFSVVNDTTADTNDSWFWLSSSSQVGGNAHTSSNPAFGWTLGGTELAFQLTNGVPIPEPSSLAIWAVAIGCGVGCLHRTDPPRRAGFRQGSLGARASL
jgi:hypothetical protein